MWRVLSILFVIFLGVRYYTSPAEYKRCVHVCDWFGQIPPSVIKDFEKETGIKVIYDAVEGNEVLETKLFAGRCGWDVVFPTSSPYLLRQIQAGVYLPLNKTMIPNIQHIDPDFLKHAKTIDPDLTFSVPYIWGMMAFVINEERLKDFMPQGVFDDYHVLFSPEYAKKLAPAGISLLTEFDEVFSVLLHYLKLPPETADMRIIDKAVAHLLKIRPHIKKFTAARVVNDMVMGEIALAQCWSFEGNRAVNEAKEVGKKLKCVLPRQGTLIFGDHIAVPKDAPHPQEAFIFINYLLEPRVAGRFTEHSGIATSVLKSQKYIEKNDPNVFPSKEYLKLCYRENVRERLKNKRFGQQMSARWAMIRYK